MSQWYQSGDRKKRGNNDSAPQGPPKIQVMAIFVLYHPSIVILLCMNHYDSALGSHSYQRKARREKVGFPLRNQSGRCPWHFNTGRISHMKIRSWNGSRTVSAGLCPAKHFRTRKKRREHLLGNKIRMYMIYTKALNTWSQ